MVKFPVKCKLLFQLISIETEAWAANRWGFIIRFKKISASSLFRKINTKHTGFYSLKRARELSRYVLQNGEIPSRRMQTYFGPFVVSAQNMTFIGILTVWSTFAGNLIAFWTLLSSIFRYALFSIGKGKHSSWLAFCFNLVLVLVSEVWK